ncbi:MRG/MORF4L-binding protein [Sceloporus undulatus]|uniref:MRG/MORF4L-binding protein n=1 Tax=Sceloporus undulatus TaxID=8520 RepID=UPI001C4B939A|nr:MRG/MORF4L-binding protein [Sceloporus undulatus]
MGDAESSASEASGPTKALAVPAVAPEPPPSSSSQASASEESAASSASGASASAGAMPTPAAATAAPPPPPPPLPLPPVPVVWSPEVEVCLFHAMLGHKPVGVNRHFHMICIRDKFSQNIGRQISSKVIWDHLSTMYDMQALHESEILPFPNSEKNFILPEEIIQEVKEGKVMAEDDVKEEIKEEMESHGGPEEVYASLGSLAKTAEKPSGKEKERSSSESGSKEGSDKRKRNRVTEKVLNANSNPSSPSAAKRRRT